MRSVVIKHVFGGEIWQCILHQMVERKKEEEKRPLTHIHVHRKTDAHAHSVLYQLIGEEGRNAHIGCVFCCVLFFAKHIIVGLLFRNIHPSLQYSSRSRIHTSLYDFCSSHVHPAL